MLRRSLFVFLAVASSLISLDAFAAPGSSMTIAQVNCNGTAVVRSTVGQIEVIAVDKNIPGCIGTAGTTDATAAAMTATLSGSVKKPAYDVAKNGPLLDLTSEQIGEYRIEQMKQQGIKYANPVRSVRAHKAASKSSTTTAYLMKNDAVVTTGSGAGWTPVQGAEVTVTDAHENTVAAGTGGKAKGYVATRFLRDPNPSDLVRIKQADQAYWSDIAHVNVAHLVNVREHAWYGSKILFVLSNKTPLYVVSTVDDWSEVISDDRTIHGYVKSKYITIDKAQRVEPKPLLK